MSRKAVTLSEDDLLQWRLQHAQWLAGMLQEPTSLAALTVGAYAELLDDVCAEVALEAHREFKTGTLLPHTHQHQQHHVDHQHQQQPGDTAAAAQLAGSAGLQYSQQPPPKPRPLDPLPGVKGPTDVFGQVHPGTATDVVVCMSCGRKAQAGKFAYHLEKCLGKGRQASARQTSRRTGT